MTNEIDSRIVRVCISAEDTLEPGWEPGYMVLGVQDEETIKQYGYVQVYSTTISFPRPTRRETAPAQVELLRAKIKTVQAQAGSEVNRIEEQIGKLLAIGYEGEGS